jgi:hypothetical protein
MARQRADIFSLYLPTARKFESGLPIKTYVVFTNDPSCDIRPLSDYGIAMYCLLLVFWTYRLYSKFIQPIKRKMYSNLLSLSCICVH